MKDMGPGIIRGPISHIFGHLIVHIYRYIRYEANCELETRYMEGKSSVSPLLYIFGVRAYYYQKHVRNG